MSCCNISLQSNKFQLVANFINSIVHVCYAQLVELSSGIYKHDYKATLTDSESLQIQKKLPEIQTEIHNNMQLDLLCIHV